MNYNTPICLKYQSSPAILLVLAAISIISMNSAGLMLTMFLSITQKQKIILRLIIVVALDSLFWALSDVILSVIMIFLSVNSCSYELCIVRNITIHFWPLTTMFMMTAISIYSLYSLFADRVLGLTPLNFKIIVFLVHIAAAVDTALALTVPEAILKQEYKYEDSKYAWCTLNSTSLQYFWYYPVGLTVFICGTLYLVVIVRSGYLIVENMKRRIPFRYSFYILSSLVVWFPFIFEFFLFTTNNNQRPDVPYWYGMFELIFVHSQGLLFFIVYFFTNPMVISEYSWKVGIVLWFLGPFWLVVVAIRLLISKWKERSQSYYDLIQEEQSETSS